MSADSFSARDRVFALLFVADEPVTPSTLARATALTEGQVEQALEVLARQLRKEGPLQLVQLAGGYQLSTKPDLAELISAFMAPQRSKLSRALMEVLAIVAYRQPITMAEIEAVRGVQSDHAVRSLVERRLVEEVGRRPSPGRPLLYGTTSQFLHQFKLNDLGELPPLDTDPPVEVKALESSIRSLDSGEMAAAEPDQAGDWR
jgi:segregation and condensation protein B